MQKIVQNRTQGLLCINLLPKLNTNIKQTQRCLLCDNIKCVQSVDHSFTSRSMVLQLAKVYYVSNPTLKQTKVLVKHFYNKITKIIRKQIKQIQNQTQIYLNSLSYGQLSNNINIDTKFLGQLAEQQYSNSNHRSLTVNHNRIKSTIRQLHRLQQSNIKQNSIFLSKTMQSDQQDDQTCINMLHQQTASVFATNLTHKINNFNYQNLSEHVTKLINIFVRQQRGQVLSTTMKNATFIQNGFVCQLQSQYKYQCRLQVERRVKSQQQIIHNQQIIMWQVPIRSKLKNLPLSNKRITDSQLLINLPKLHSRSFTSITQLSLRNNPITAVGCISIKTYMPQLIVLDLRGIPTIGTKGVKKLGQLHNLKQLFVDQCQLNDQAAVAVAQQNAYKCLQILWADHNFITSQGVKLLCSKNSLRVISVVGNCVNRVDYFQCKNMFKTKGIIHL